MQQRTQARALLFFRPVILGVGFVLEVAFYALFGWWLLPWLSYKANRELVDDVTRNLYFLVSEPGSMRILHGDWPTVEIRSGNLLLRVVRWRGETSVSIAPSYDPVRFYRLGPLVAAFEHRHLSERDSVDNLRDAGDLLRPRLEALNAAFSVEDFPRIKERL